jgi:hypothetical protein
MKPIFGWSPTSTPTVSPPTRAATGTASISTATSPTASVLGAPGTTYYPGPRPLSEPESVSIAALVHRLRPRITIYYHQHQAVVDDSQGPRWIERRYAADVGLPLRRLTDYPGSATGWQDAQLGPTAFVVELSAGPLSRRQIDAHTDALLDVLPAA